MMMPKSIAPIERRLAAPSCACNTINANNRESGIVSATIIIVALTIPLSLLFAFIVLHAHDGAANLLSIGAIDFGIIIDGTVVMVENIYRELALRQGQSY